MTLVDAGSETSNHKLRGRPLPRLFVSAEARMRHVGLCLAAVSLGACVGVAAGQRPADSSTMLRLLTRVTALSSSYRPIGTLGNRGTFYATGTPLHRVDDGDTHHGLPATAAWATKPKDKRAQAQGVVYGVEDGRITSAGYVI